MSRAQPAVSILLRTRIHVCSLAAVPETVAAVKATHLMTVINGQTLVETPASIEANKHLKIAVNDISLPQEGLVHPRAEHVEEIIRFAREWDHAGPLVVHCWAGISRSTAATFITLCTLNEGGVEASIARSIRTASKTATPNALMISIADDLLGRRGKMVDAIAAIGQGEMALSGVPFSLSSRFQATH